ncbi:cupin domain-containing protein [Pseudomonas sp. FP597]|uniref:cupin domain-containing protein n=1 Tax=Pseudomonas sp. FP597 TaxID=2954096 RepID=UPI002732F6ED|nr:cupin domain-containing protein [Pseudomonas sp. FP597]WLI07438.1 cupin domain-containing protein [Pseudomonas sp. FP597]
MFNKKVFSAISLGRKLIRENGILIVEHKMKNRCGAGFFIVSSGQTTGIDTHKVRELWIVLSGQGCLSRGTDEYEVSPGSVFAFSPFQEHQLFASKGQAVTVFNIWWHDE